MCLGAVAWAVLGAGVGAAQPVLHERVPGVREDETVLITGGDGRASALVYDGEVLPMPANGVRKYDEKALTAGEPRGTSDGEAAPPKFSPDRITDFEGQAGYYEVFTPAITPFKRTSALDAVVIGDDGRTPVLTVLSTEGTLVPVEGMNGAAPDGRPRDRFWGSVVLDFSKGRRVPFPSVSPESRILMLQTTPPANVRVEKDRADNFYAVGTGRLPQEVRVVFLTDAPRSYFGEALPDGVSDATAAELGALPAKVAEQARSFAAAHGLRRGMPVRTLLTELTRHFRSFEESEDPPSDTGNIYLDLAQGMKGVCRHRAYAFVITARALGINARFVMNEAHSWVEARVPTLGWVRIDLGGAATGLAPHNTGDRPTYKPANPDPFPRPEAYLRAYAEARAFQMSLAKRGQDGAAMGAAGDERAGKGDRGHGTRPVGTNENLSPATDEEVNDGDGRRTPDGTGLTVMLDQRDYQVFRGRSLDVTGRVVDSAGRGIAGLRVEFSLEGAASVALGVTATQANGYFQATVGVPPALSVGEYRLHVRTPGNGTWGPAEAR